jgi:hypothetical protein
MEEQGRSNTREDNVFSNFSSEKFWELSDKMIKKGPLSENLVAQKRTHIIKERSKRSIIIIINNNYDPNQPKLSNYTDETRHIN